MFLRSKYVCLNAITDSYISIIAGHFAGNFAFMQEQTPDTIEINKQTSDSSLKN
jgi:hypothetical protein